MRVIAGTAKGIRLATVPGGTRPLSDRAREGLFSSLGPSVAGTRFLDVFAGTGAVGIEALSRGAASAQFVESGPAAVRTIRENLRRAGLDSRAQVRREDGRRLAYRGDPFDIVFLDPPYAIPARDLDTVLARIAEPGLLAPGALVIVTRREGSYTPVVPVHWAPDRRLSYGDTVILAYRT